MSVTDIIGEIAVTFVCGLLAWRILRHIVWPLCCNLFWLVVCSIGWCFGKDAYHSGFWVGTMWFGTVLPKLRWAVPRLVGAFLLVQFVHWAWYF